MNSNPMLFEEPCNFSYSCRDTNDMPQACHILQVFQDISSDHCEAIGIGYQGLLKQNLIWVVTKIRFQIVKPLPMINLTAVTWPLKKGTLDFCREYQIKDGNDILIKGCARWCLIDITTRKIVRANKISYPSDNYVPKNNFEEPYFSLTPFDYSSIPPSITHLVTFSELDHNKHLNNTHYASYSVDSIPDIEHMEVIDMEVNFLHECHLGQTIKTYTIKDSDTSYQIIGVRDDGEMSFHSIVFTKRI